jgi:hypothetical protein
VPTRRQGARSVSRAPRRRTIEYGVRKTRRPSGSAATQTAAATAPATAPRTMS